MIEFVKIIINNNILVVLGLIIVITFLSLLAVEKIRKAIFGSLVTIAISFSLALASRFEMLNDAFTYVYRSIVLFFGKNEMNYLVVNHRNALISITTVEREFNLKFTDIIDYLNFVNVSISSIVETYSEIKLNLIKKVLVFKNILFNRTNLSKYSFAMRI